jgi:diguanylate cyclase (GGDEF)-like protein/PAS domain S-box-containing protein
LRRFHKNIPSLIVTQRITKSYDRQFFKGVVYFSLKILQKLLRYVILALQVKNDGEEPYLRHLIKKGDSTILEPPFVFIRSKGMAEETKEQLLNGIKDLQEAQGQYGALVENVNIGVYRNTAGPTGCFIQANPAMAKIFGYDSIQEFMEVSVSDLYQNPEDRRLFVEEMLKNGFVKDKELRLQKKDGTPICCSCTARVQYDESGEIKWIDGAIEDITERKEAEEELKESEERFRTLFDNVTDGILLVDMETRQFQLGNSMISKMLQYTPEEIKKLSVMDIHAKEDLPYVIEQFNRIIRGEITLAEDIPVKRKDGSIFYADINNSFITLAGKKYLIGIFRDITERKRSEDKLEVLNKELLKSNRRLKQLALRDSHTGLYNHRYLAEIIEKEFYRAKRFGQPLSVIMFDIDYFKSINDVYGHQFGDLVLKQFASELKKIVRQYDTIVRFGGEEFVLVSPGVDRSKATVLAQRILDAVRLCNFGNKEQTVKLKLSLAVASYPQDKITKGIELVDLVDRILNKVKEDGGDKVYSSLDITKVEFNGYKKAGEDKDTQILKEKIEKLTKRSNQSLIEAVFAFAKTIKLKDHYTGEHVESTVKYATEIARTLELPKDEVESVKQAAILHDLGKIGISERILLKKSKLTRREFDEIKKHPQIAADIIRPIHFLHKIIPLVLHHHERWDGKGYPSGLKGEEIVIGARIIAIADIYQALISNRPYRKAYGQNEAIDIIKDGSGTQFDPKIVEVFLHIIRHKK